MEIAKSKIIITGGAGSFGKFIASEFSGLGAKVLIIDRDKEKIMTVCTENNNINGYVCDLTDFTEITKCINKIFKEHPDVSVLINNAGFIHSAPLINLISPEDRRHDFSQWQKVIDTNLTSVFNASVNVIDNMIRNRIRGLIINISSVSASGNPGQTAYSAAKAGVDSLTKTWSKELFMFGIRVAGVSPGFFDTDSTRNALNEKQIDKIVKKIPSQRLGKLAELFSAVKFIVENDYFNGKILKIDGGLVL